MESGTTPSRGPTTSPWQARASCNYSCNRSAGFALGHGDGDGDGDSAEGFHFFFFIFSYKRRMERCS